MDLAPWASTVLVIFYILFSLLSIAAFVGLAIAVRALNHKLADLSAKVDPLLTKADEVLSVASEKIASIGDRAEGILTHGEETAETVHHKVDRTATAVHRTVNAPIIAINSFAAGVSRGVTTFGRLQRHQGNGAATPTIATANAWAATAPPVISSVDATHTPERVREEETGTPNGYTAAEAISVPAGGEK